MAERQEQRQPSLRSRQAAATRALIVQAAGAAFAANGYERARVEATAGAAGVAYPTVYKAFANKRNLLAAAVRSAMTGGSEDDVDRQRWFIEQLEEPDPRRQLRLVARNARRLNERAGRLLEAVRAAGRADGEIARLWRDINDDRLARSRTTATALARKTPVRGTVARCARTLWTLTLPELYVVQVEAAGLTGGSYQRWLADLLVAALLPDA